MPDVSVHVIDDDPAICDSLAALLESAGFVVRTYSSPVTFLETLSSETVGCVVTDIHMPQLTGLQLLRRVKAAYPQLPVIVMSGGAGRASGPAALADGAAAFLEKPFDEEAMIRAVQAATEGIGAGLPS